MLYCPEGKEMSELLDLEQRSEEQVYIQWVLPKVEQMEGHWKTRVPASSEQKFFS